MEYIIVANIWAAASFCGSGEKERIACLIFAGAWLVLAIVEKF